MRPWPVVTALILWWGSSGETTAFDHGFAAYGELLGTVVHGSLVDYATIKADRSRFDRVIGTFAQPSRSEEEAWSREQRLAFWINAYNALTLLAIVDHYPIRASMFTRLPRNSIRQIDGVWTTLTWPAAGRRVTLDDIEHKILRPDFGDARVHFAINCASVSCPPLAAEPYRSDTLDTALDAAAVRYLGSTEGLRVAGNTFSVSSIFKWYGDDFIAQYASSGPDGADPRERAVLGAIVRFGPADTAARVRAGRPSLVYLDYNWALNDIAR